jgi:hypothetical protein
VSMRGGRDRNVLAGLNFFLLDGAIRNLIKRCIVLFKKIFQVKCNVIVQ